MRNGMKKPERKKEKDQNEIKILRKKGKEGEKKKNFKLRESKQKEINSKTGGEG